MQPKWLMKQQERQDQEIAARQEAIGVLAELDHDEAEDIIIPEAMQEAKAPENTYTWVEGDILSKVAARLNVGRQELLYVNKITDPNDIEPGEVLELPKPRTVTMLDDILYQAYKEPKLMHVVHGGGTHKVIFGNVRKWGDVLPTGTLHRHNKNLWIVGQASVMIEGDEFIFLMDKLSMGDYEQSGKVTFTTGFIPSQLADGHVPQNKVPLAKVVSEKVEEAAKKLEQLNDIALDVRPNEYKASLKPLREDGEPEFMQMKEDYVVHEHDTKKKSKFLKKGTPVSVIASFEKDGRTYYRPTNTYFWFGIPPEMLEPYADPEDDDDDPVYNLHIPLAERATYEGGRLLTPTERYLVLPSFWVINKIKKLLTKNKEQ